MPSALANRFANALADAVLSSPSREPQKALEELYTFERMVKESPDFRNVLLSPAVSIAKKHAVVDRFARSMPLSPTIRNFLFVVIARRRTDILLEIASAFETALDDRIGIVRADVRSAAPLDAEHQATLQQQLSAVAGKQVRCAFSVDPDLIGGVVARIGSTVYDGSVRTQLEQMRERLTSR